MAEPALPEAGSLEQYDKLISLICPIGLNGYSNTIHFYCLRHSLSNEKGKMVLTEAGLLPGGLKGKPYVDFYVAHHDGNYAADEETLDRLEGEGRAAFRYVTNPNGSARSIAGIVSEGGNVLGIRDRAHCCRVCFPRPGPISLALTSERGEFP